MRPGVSMGVLGCPGVIRPTRRFCSSDTHLFPDNVVARGGVGLTSYQHSGLMEVVPGNFR